MRSSMPCLALCALLAGCLPAEEDPACVDCDTPDAAEVLPDGGEPAEEPCREDDPPLDLLFVIDNSGSMCEEQAALVDGFDALQAAFAGRDWRIAVTSTDMNPDNGERGAFGIGPALPVPSLNCIGDDGEAAVPDTAGCHELFGEQVIDATAFDADDLARRFRCMATLGTQGDGYEKPLAAAARALDCDGPNAGLLAPCGGADPQFLRPGAALAVIYIGDEDDCSDRIDGMPGAIPCLDEDGDGRCEVPPVHNSSCVWYPDALEPVQTFVDGLRRANPLAPGVTALSVAGPRFDPIDGQPVRFVPGAAEGMCRDADGRTVVSAMCCPEGRCQGELAPVCAGPSGTAFAGNRLRTMDEAFPGGCAGGDCGSICDGQVMVDLADRLLAKLDAALPARCE